MEMLAMHIFSANVANETVRAGKTREYACMCKCVCDYNALITIVNNTSKVERYLILFDRQSTVVCILHELTEIISVIIVVVFVVVELSIRNIEIRVGVAYLFEAIL